MKRFANIVSTLFHPLLMVTYAVLLALGFTYLNIYPLVLKTYILLGAVLCTLILPGAMVVWLVKSGLAGDMELSERRERVLPYLLFITGNMFCFFYLYKMQMPWWVLSILLGACLSLFAALLVNFAWKISVHTLGLGCLLGAIMGVARIQSTNPYWLFIAVIIAAGLTGTARVLLRKHTTVQVFAGFFLGFACTFGTSFLNFIYLII